MEKCILFSKKKSKNSETQLIAVNYDKVLFADSTVMEKVDGDNNEYIIKINLKW